MEYIILYLFMALISMCMLNLFTILLLIFIKQIGQVCTKKVHQMIKNIYNLEREREKFVVTKNTIFRVTGLLFNVY